jgi:two-component system sensor histidine kinase BarA
MDVHLPDMSGTAVTAALRARERDRHTPVIALTADALAGSRERFLAAGMDDYLPKPVDDPTLCAMVERWTGRGSVLSVREPDAPPVGYAEAHRQQPLVLDRDAAMKTTMGHQALADELLGMLLNELGTAEQRLADGLARGDLSSVADVAHKLAGGASHCGAFALGVSALELERVARNGEAVIRSVASVRREMDRLREAARDLHWTRHTVDEAVTG